MKVVFKSEGGGPGGVFNSSQIFSYACVGAIDEWFCTDVTDGSVGKFIRLGTCIFSGGIFLRIH